MENYLKIKLVRNFGAVGSLEIELSATKAMDSKGGLVEFNLMIDQAEVLMDNFIADRLPHMKVAPMPKQVEVQKFNATKISVTMKDGKKLWRVICPPLYEDFGIPFYPEHMRKCGIDPRNIPDEGYVFKKEVEAVVEFEKGVPKRVVEIVEKKR